MKTRILKTRTEIKLLEKQSELLALNKKATEAQGYPTLSLAANYGYLGIGDKFPWFQSYPAAYWSWFFCDRFKEFKHSYFNGGSVKAKQNKHR